MSHGVKHAAHLEENLIDLQPERELLFQTQFKSVVAAASEGAETMKSEASKMVAVAERSSAVSINVTAVCDQTSRSVQAVAAAAGQLSIALNEVGSYDPHILLLDLNLPRKNGLEVLQELNTRGLRIPTIVISGQGGIPDVVKTIKLGAYDYLRKPVDTSHLKVMLNNLAAHITVAEENERLRRRLMEAGKLGPMIGQSRAMQQVMVAIKQVAPTHRLASIE